MQRRTYLQCVTGAVGTTAGLGASQTGVRAQQSTDETPTQQAKLTPDDSDTEDGFGGAVALDGDRALIGAAGDDTNGENAGTAYVFERSGGTWTEAAKLIADDGDDGDGFGRAVALDGDTALVGAESDEDPNGDRAGSAYVFELSGGTWTEVAKLAPDGGDGGDEFGSSVALDGEAALLGAPGDADPNGPSAGSGYVYRRVDGSWVQETKLTPDDGDGRDYFGEAVALDAGTAVLGASGDEDPNGRNAGSAYVFERTNGIWLQETKLTPDDGDDGDNFGESVALDGGRVLVGALTDEDPNGRNAGSAYLFSQIEDSWVQETKLAADDGDPDDGFGETLALDGGTAIVCTFRDETPNGFSAGSGYAFERTDGVWIQNARFFPDDGESYDSFGSAVSVDGGRILVGATGDDPTDTNGENVGSAYVFQAGGNGAGDLPTDDPSFQEVLAVIEAFNDDGQYNGVDVGFQDVLAVIGAFNSN